MDRWQNFSGHWGMPLGLQLFLGIGAMLFLGLIIWSVAWKGMALWKAARRGEKRWFIALLIINTIGILDILYIYVLSKDAPPATGGEKK